MWSPSADPIPPSAMSSDGWLLVLPDAPPVARHAGGRGSGNNETSMSTSGMGLPSDSGNQTTDSLVSEATQTPGQLDSLLPRLNLARPAGAGVVGGAVGVPPITAEAGKSVSRDNNAAASVSQVEPVSGSLPTPPPETSDRSWTADESAENSAENDDLVSLTLDHDDLMTAESSSRPRAHLPPRSSSSLRPTFHHHSHVQHHSQRVTARDEVSDVGRLDHFSANDDDAASEASTRGDTDSTAVEGNRAVQFGGYSELSITREDDVIIRDENRFKKAFHNDLNDTDGGNVKTALRPPKLMRQRNSTSPVDGPLSLEVSVDGTRERGANPAFAMTAFTAPQLSAAETSVTSAMTFGSDSTNALNDGFSIDSADVLSIEELREVMSRTQVLEPPVLSSSQ